jgi:uncharacterized protein
MTTSPSRTVFALWLPATLLAATPLNAAAHKTGRFDEYELAVLKAAAAGLAALAKLVPLCSPRLLGTADDGPTLLQWMLMHVRKRAFLALLRSGADPAQPGFDGETAVHNAARHRDPEWLKLLL